MDVKLCAKLQDGTPESEHRRYWRTLDSGMFARVPAAYETVMVDDLRFVVTSVEHDVTGNENDRSVCLHGMTWETPPDAWVVEELDVDR